MKDRRTLENIPERWLLEVPVGPGAAGELLSLRGAGDPVLSLRREAEGLCAAVHTFWPVDTARFGKSPRFTFRLVAPAAEGLVRLEWRGYSLRLYVNGTLQDEDWPLGAPPKGPWVLAADETVGEAAFAPAPPPQPDPERSWDKPFQFFVPPGHNTRVGDCMPFARDGRFCLYYLLDRRGHHSKMGLGAHQWAQISTGDLRHWTLHPMAVGITEQGEGSICTGSLIRRGDTIYAFYAVRAANGSPARLTYATSSDGVHFEKSGKTFALTDPFEPVSARDPMVFCDEEGLYHMLVTTSLVAGGPRGGCLAHLTSPDLEHWAQQAEPFLVPGYDDQPECSDYFFWNGWYYLVYSNYATARYRLSRQPFGPWLRPDVDELDAAEVQVPKTAAFQGRRFSVGFLARRPRDYAGSAVMHELFQRSDGTLGVRHVEEILPSGTSVPCPAASVLEAGANLAVHPLPAVAHDLRLKALLTPRTPGMRMGLFLRCGEGDDHIYRLELDPAAGVARVFRPGESFSRGAGREQLRGLAGLTAGAAIDLVLRGDILDLMLGDGRALTLRLDERPQGVHIEFYAQAGTLEVSRIALETYES